VLVKHFDLLWLEPLGLLQVEDGPEACSDGEESEYHEQPGSAVLQGPWGDQGNQDGHYSHCQVRKTHCLFLAYFSNVYPGDSTERELEGNHEGEHRDNFYNWSLESVANCSGDQETTENERAYSENRPSSPSLEDEEGEDASNKVDEASEDSGSSGIYVGEHVVNGAGVEEDGIHTSQLSEARQNDSSEGGVFEFVVAEDCSEGGSVVFGLVFFFNDYLINHSQYECLVVYLAHQLIQLLVFFSFLEVLGGVVFVDEDHHEDLVGTDEDGEEEHPDVVVLHGTGLLPGQVVAIIESVSDFEVAWNGFVL